jgi:hypothetical protein
MPPQRLKRPIDPSPVRPAGIIPSARSLRQSLPAAWAVLSLPWSTTPVEGQINPAEDDQAPDVRPRRF